MHPGKTSRGIEEISSLFISERGEAAGKAPSGQAELAVHLAVTGRGLCRAFIGCGLARAVSAGPVDVTLVETGLSLPNSGYYFGLDARSYLAPALGLKRSVSAAKGDSLRFIYAPRPSGLEPHPDRCAPPSRPHLVINLFDATSLAAGGSMPTELFSVPSSYRRQQDGRGRRDLLVIVSGDEGTEPGRKREREVLASSFVSRSGGGEVCEYAAGSAGAGGGLSSRSLPVGAVFEGLAARVLAGGCARRGGGEQA